MNAHLKRNKWMITTVCLVAIALLAGGLFLTRGLFSRMGDIFSIGSGNRVIDFHTINGLDPQIIEIILDDKRVPTSHAPLIEDGIIYLSEDFIHSYIDPFLFWDQHANKVIVTSLTDILHFTPDTLTFTINHNPHSLAYPVKRADDVTYLPGDLFMGLYPYHVVYQPAYNLVVITTNRESLAEGELTAKTNIRYLPDKKTAIVLKANKGMALQVYEEEGDFTRVRTTDGLLGYVPTSDITVRQTEQVAPDYLLLQPITNYEPLTPMWPVGKKINLMWEDVNNPDAILLKMQTPIPDGVNIMSPKFFMLGEETVLESIASHDYVAWAHGQGVQVWGMMEGGNSDINGNALVNPINRQYIVRALSEYAQEYKLDGINIDIEYLKAGDGPYLIQFLRELAIEIRPQGIVLSVDVLVPQAWSAFYRRDLMALTADFLCVMTYDEHYRTSENSGPVASLPFVLKGVTDMLENENVPKEQLLMGLPFYNRVWVEQLNNDSPDNRIVDHFNMERTKAFFKDNDVIPEWDHFSGSFYGEFAAVRDGVTVKYRIWLEDENSIAEKLKIFTEHDLAGVAGWRRGYENEETQVRLMEATQ